MSPPFKQWTVLPHGRLTRIADNVSTVVGDIRMPLMHLPRRMTVVRLDDGRLVIFNGVALDEGEMATLESYGVPAYLIVPNGKHRMDARIWKQRYPNLQVVAPVGAREAVEEVVPVDTTAPDFGDPKVQFITVAGTREREAALLVHSARGTTLVLNDLIGNIRQARGFGGWLLKRIGFAGSTPQIPKVVKVSLIDDCAALRAQLLQWSGIESLKWVLVSHGEVIDQEAPEVLRKVAEALDE